MFLGGLWHGNFVRKGSLFGARELPQAEASAHAIRALKLHSSLACSGQQSML